MLKLKSACWIAIAVVLFLVFWKYSPAILFHSLGIFLYLIEALLCGLFLFSGLIDLENFKDLRSIKKSKYPKSTATHILIITILLIFVSFAVFSLSTAARIEKMFITEGIETVATITDGQSKISLSAAGVNGEYTIQLHFIDQDSIEHTISHKVDPKVFEKVYKNQEIKIKYLPDNCDMIKLIAY